MIFNLGLLCYLCFLYFSSSDMCFSSTSRSNRQGNRYLTISQSCPWLHPLSSRDVWMGFSYICSPIPLHTPVCLHGLPYHSVLFPFMVHWKMTLLLVGPEHYFVSSAFYETIGALPTLLRHCWAPWSQSAQGMAINVLCNAHKSWCYCTARFYCRINPIYHIPQGTENLLWPRVKQTVTSLKTLRSRITKASFYLEWGAIWIHGFFGILYFQMATGLNQLVPGCIKRISSSSTVLFFSFFLKLLNVFVLILFWKKLQP